MKIFSSILIGSILLLGCSRQSPKPQEVKYETMTIEWLKENDIVRSLGYTNHCIIVSTVTATETNSIATDVGSIDDAGNFLGQYGWELVSAENNSDYEIYHMKRQVRDDGKAFSYEGIAAAQFNK